MINRAINLKFSPPTEQNVNEGCYKKRNIIEFSSVFKCKFSYTEEPSQNNDLNITIIDQLSQINFHKTTIIYQLSQNKYLRSRTITKISQIYFQNTTFTDNPSQNSYHRSTITY